MRLDPGLRDVASSDDVGDIAGDRAPSVPRLPILNIDLRKSMTRPGSEASANPSTEPRRRFALNRLPALLRVGLDAESKDDNSRHSDSKNCASEAVAPAPQSRLISPGRSVLADRTAACWADIQPAPAQIVNHLVRSGSPVSRHRHHVEPSIADRQNTRPALRLEISHTK